MWSTKTQDNAAHLFTSYIREGFKKKCEKVWSFAKLGRGSPGVVKKPYCFFEKVSLLDPI